MYNYGMQRQQPDSERLSQATSVVSFSSTLSLVAEATETPDKASSADVIASHLQTPKQELLGLAFRPHVDSGS